jgi:ubiquinone/menaquinone biosynthesis C-methylase UbiE
VTVAAAIVSQFKQPHGLLGRVAGSIMANRPSNRRRNLWTLDLLAIRPDDRVLEIGCGPGLALAACAERLETGLITGLDHSQTMIDQARKRNRETIDSNHVRLVRGNLSRLSELPGNFDKVFSVNVVQFFENSLDAFRTLYRVTAPKGLVASTYQPRHAKATRNDALSMAAEIEGAMADAGFVGIRCGELPLVPVPAVCVLGIRPLP